MDKFEYKGKAEIKHLNVRKEGPEDDKNLAVDVKLQCVASAELFDFFHEGLRKVLFTDIGAVKNYYLNALTFSNKIKNCELEIAGQRYLGVDIHKFTLEPKDTDQVTMTFSACISPTSNQVAILAEFVMDEVSIEVMPSPELDFGESETSPSDSDTTAQLTDDGLYDQAVKVVLEQRRVSISLVQRHLRIGYNRAARLVETMEERGVVGPMQSNGNREVLKEAA